jgi:hypothetical protein
MIMTVASTLCYLSLQGVTMSYMNGRPATLVRRCTYECQDKKRTKKTHQIYYDDRCPKIINKNVRSLYYGR